jgi:hypothetical protein
VPACEEEGLSLDPLRTYLNQENSKEGLSLDPPKRIRGANLNQVQEKKKKGGLSLDPPKRIRGANLNQEQVKKSQDRKGLILEPHPRGFEVPI